MKEIPLDYFVEAGSAPQTFSVRLTSDAWSATASFQYDLGSTCLREVIDKIEGNCCALDDLKLIGASLWAGLMSGDIGKLFATVRQQASREPVRLVFRLHLPFDRELDRLPWEALYSENDFGFVASHRHHVVVRAPPGTLDRAATAEPPRPVRERLRVLVVVPSGSGLDVERELNNVENAVGKLRERVLLQRLTGQVYPDSLARALRESNWDVLHFIGHGQLTERGRPTVRFNSDDGLAETWMDGEAFGQLFVDSGVRLAVLNCCLSATSSPLLRSMGALGHLVLRAGVPAVVAMRYEVPDPVAVRFSDRFYSELLSGDAPGRVDLAVERARESIFGNQREDQARDFVTPALFVVPGLEQLFELEPVKTTSASHSIRRRVDVDLPSELVEALAGGSCVPVVGPRVLAGTMMRGPGAALSPPALAKRLAERFAYPYPKDFELSETAGDWMDSYLLQRVCQHGEAVASKKNESYKLPQFIQTAYRAAEPPDLLAQLAGWTLPGVFYLFFDGLLEEAFTSGRRPVRVANVIDDPVPPGGETLLVNVRGTHTNPGTLVLTEQDHDRLWDRIGRMTPEIAELVRGHMGRSLFFLGANPRDPLVKRLAAKLLEQTSARTRGPIFFLCRPGERSDPYWHDVPVVWIEGEPEAVVEALSAALGKGC